MDDERADILDLEKIAPQFYEWEKKIVKDLVEVINYESIFPSSSK